MEFDKTRWSCPWNGDQNCTQNFPRGCGVQGLVVLMCGGLGVWGSMGVEMLGTRGTRVQREWGLPGI